jgi:purine-binding chemotaxis protein CheW
VSAEQIEATPEFGTNISTQFILGLAKIGKNVVILLDADCILSVGELREAAVTAG